MDVYGFSPLTDAAIVVGFVVVAVLVAVWIERDRNE